MNEVAIDNKIIVTTKMGIVLNLKAKIDILIMFKDCF